MFDTQNPPHRRGAASDRCQPNVMDENTQI